MSTEAHAIWASPEDPAFAAFAAREVAGDATLFDGALLIAHWLAGASVEDACEAPLEACCEAASRWVAPRFDAATHQRMLTPGWFSDLTLLTVRTTDEVESKSSWEILSLWTHSLRHS